MIIKRMFKLYRHRFKFILLAFIALLVIFSHILNIPSNLELLFDQQSGMVIKQDKVWIDPDNAELDKLGGIIYQTDNVSIRKIYIRRSERNFIARMKDVILPNKMLVFTFSHRNDFLLIADEENDLQPITSRNAMRKKPGMDFVLNANLYWPDNKVMGELIMNNKRYCWPNEEFTTFFKVVDDRARVGPESIFKNMTGKVSYSCQAYPSVLRDGRLFDYVLTEKSPYKPKWKSKFYRNLAGEDENGNIVFIVSNRGGLLSVKEIAQLAHLVGVKNAGLFDGGAALQYIYRGGKRISFSAFNNVLDLGDKFSRSTKRRYEVSFFQQSPVYFGVSLQE